MIDLAGVRPNPSEYLVRNLRSAANALCRAGAQNCWSLDGYACSILSPNVDTNLLAVYCLGVLSLLKSNKRDLRLLYSWIFGHPPTYVCI